ncbi:UvrD-helicase domain-containing protein [bacterium]|nr:UvrD-helicase domain-containing protein [bacterium]
MTQLEVVRAGAGSGKTTDLCQTVADAVVGGLDPARVLATTFTKKAAAELKGRIQAKLLDGAGGRVAAQQHADRLELAAIGTVHSVAHQLLSRYAIELGLSPRLEVITEEASDRALSDLLGVIPAEAWQPLADGAERLGINDLHRRVLGLLAAKRGNRISDDNFTDQMSASADRICEILAPDGVSSVESGIGQLYDLAELALANIDSLVNDVQKNTNTARQKLRQLKSKRIPLWGSYLAAKKISAGKTSGADAMLDQLRTYAAQVSTNPRLHSDIRDFTSALAAETIRLDSQYETYKRERGLVDFTDLEILLLKLLEDESLAARLAEDFDLVLVDEFQDTNPLQLAIFQQLRQLSPRSRWVGDPKQAIYGFRDTDPALVDDIWKNATDATRTELPSNHRSQRGLVQLVGILFSPLFGDDAIQEPQKPAMDRGVERWIFDSKNQSDDQMSLACGVSQLHAEGIRFGDIAILERSNRQLQTIAAAFDELGIPYLLASAGLFSTREGAVVLAGLRLVADRNDSLSAATILHLLSDPKKNTPDWIGERLAVLRTADAATAAAAVAGEEPARKYRVAWEGDDRFAGIEDIDPSLLSPTLVVQRVIEAMDLPTLIQKWGDPARRCSNLDSILKHTKEHEELAIDSGQAATLSRLILCLEQLAGEGLDYRYPPQGHDAVTLMTYHAAKGLEWPIVILSGLNSDRSPDMWKPVVTGGGQSEDDPLEGRALRAWTWPFGVTDGPHGGLRNGSGLENDALASEEGLARADRESEENLRLLYVGATRAKDKLVFAHRTGKYAWLEKLANADALLTPSLEPGVHELSGIDTTYVLRRLSVDLADECQIEPREQERWVSLPDNPRQQEFDDRFHSPSQETASSRVESIRTEQLAGQSYFPTAVEEDQFSAIGNAVHSYFAALPSMRGLDDPGKERVAERCLNAFSVSGSFAPSVIVATGNRFIDWVESKFPEAQWLTEIPVTAARAAGGKWNGTLDLVLKLSNGTFVIIDHKSAPIRREYCEAKAATYAGQLEAYKEMLHTDENSVAATWIHFPLAGVAVEFA